MAAREGDDLGASLARAAANLLRGSDEEEEERFVDDDNGRAGGRSEGRGEV